MSTPEWARKIAAFDTETTGIDPFTARMVSASIAEIVDGKELLIHEWEVNPGVPIPVAASRIHGVYDEDREARLDHRLVTRALTHKLDWYWRNGWTVVAYNASFDLTLLREAYRHDHGEDWHPHGLVVDPMVIDRALDKYRKGRRTLTDQCRHYGVTLEDAHNASADALAAGHLACAVGAKWFSLLDQPDAALMSLQQKLAKENDEGLRSWFVKTGRDPREIVGGWPVRDPS